MNPYSTSDDSANRFAGNYQSNQNQYTFHAGDGKTGANRSAEPEGVTNTTTTTTTATTKQEKNFYDEQNLGGYTSMYQPSYNTRAYGMFGANELNESNPYRSNFGFNSANRGGGGGNGASGNNNFRNNNRSNDENGNMGANYMRNFRSGNNNFNTNTATSGNNMNANYSSALNNNNNNSSNANYLGTNTFNQNYNSRTFNAMNDYQNFNFRTAPPPHVISASHYHRKEKTEDEIFKEHVPGINFDQYDAIKVTVTPNDTLPVESFAEMNFEPALLENVLRCRYQKPTPVQKYGIPCVLRGRDLMACAQTGSGKTAAYLLPAINHMLVNNLNRPCNPGEQAAPCALILAPTRELSIQIYEEGIKFTYHTGIRCVVVYGGADPRHQIHELTRGCGLLVATPGRLWDMYSRGYTRFGNIRFLVLDEADRMLDMGFEPQIRQIVQGPESDMPATGERQTLLYSATFPKEIQQLAREFLYRHYFLQVGRVGSTTESITQDVRWVEDIDKRDTLLQLIHEREGQRVLVFVEKKRDADYIAHFLKNSQIKCGSIHGDRVQREREESLYFFKHGQCPVLVATDVASRGLDIPNVAMVVQYDLPSNIDDYVHRIGRTGRAGQHGVAVAFFNEKNRNIVDDLVPLLQETNQVVLPEIQALTKKAMNFVSGNVGFGRGGYGRGRMNNNNNTYNNRGGYGFGQFGGNRGGFAGSSNINNNNSSNFRSANPSMRGRGAFSANTQGGYRGRDFYSSPPSTGFNYRGNTFASNQSQEEETSD